MQGCRNACFVLWVLLHPDKCLVHTNPTASAASSVTRRQARPEPFCHVWCRQWQLLNVGTTPRCLQMLEPAQPCSTLADKISHFWCPSCLGLCHVWDWGCSYSLACPCALTKSRQWCSKSSLTNPGAPYAPVLHVFACGKEWTTVSAFSMEATFGSCNYWLWLQDK